MSQADLAYVREWAKSKLESCEDRAGSPYLVLINSLNGVLAKVESGAHPWDDPRKIPYAKK